MTGGNSDKTELRALPVPLGRDEFLKTFGGVYEKTPWIAEGVFDNGLSSGCDNIDCLAKALSDQVDQACDTRKLALLRAHPDLAGKLAAAGKLTEESKAEQAGAGLDQCTPDELAEFQSLNTQYTEHFGFPFIIAVTGMQRADILKAFRQRVGNTPETEFETALAEVHKIARIRLKALADRS